MITKEAALALLNDKKRMAKIFYVAMILLAIVLLTYFAVQYFKKKKQQEIIDAEQKRIEDLKGPAPASDGSGAPPVTNEWPLITGSRGDKVEALQKLINIIKPGSNLVPDGDFGSKTKSALVSIDPSLYPVTSEAFSKLSAMQPRTAGPGSSVRPPATGNDDLPLLEGSRGDKVKALQTMINTLHPAAKLPVNGNFDHAMYLALITFVGTKFYPVTLENLKAISALVDAKKSMPAHDFFGYIQTIRGNDPSHLQIGGRNCTKQWDVPSQQYVWNCGGGFVYNTHGQPI